MRRGSKKGKKGKKGKTLFAFFALFALFASSSHFFERNSLCKWVPTSGQQPEWTAQTSGSLAKLSGVFFIDRDRGWVVGSNGTLLVTENGGARWSPPTVPQPPPNQPV